VNKRQLIAAAARRSSLTQGQVREALESVLEAIAGALAEGDHVTLSGFGRFDVQHYAGRKLRRFDGEGHYEVQDRRVPVFRSSELLRRRLRRKGL
jgi:nucleoid DNA-binding protein